MTGSIRNFLDTHGVDLDWQEDFYRWLHQHPELSGEEKLTADAIAHKLREFHCQVRTSIGGYGITAVFENGPGPVILMRADFDGLPVQEDTGLPWSSLHEGVMHACGHDVHTSALMGLCAILDERRDIWSGTFIALFQPAEENTTGARSMVEDGLADIIPRPDICFGQHVVPGSVGTVMSAPGPVLAACDTITITLYGQSAHASMPHLSIDPGYLAAMIVVRLQGIVGREVPASEFAVISVGSIIAGHTNNTIPDTAQLILNCRFYDTDVRDQTYAAIERVVQGECQASGCPRPADILYSAHGELTDNDPDVFSRVRPQFNEVFGDLSQDSIRWTASEDFSEIPRHFGVPYLFWTVGLTDPELWEAAQDSSAIPANHQPTFAPAPGTLETCTRAAATAVLSYLGSF